nr:hypothetical protein AXF42_Ash004366 [Ipomoea batatas]
MDTSLSLLWRIEIEDKHLKELLSLLFSLSKPGKSGPCCTPDALMASGRMQLHSDPTHKERKKMNFHYVIILSQKNSKEGNKNKKFKVLAMKGWLKLMFDDRILRQRNKIRSEEQNGDMSYGIHEKDWCKREVQTIEGFFVDIFAITYRYRLQVNKTKEASVSILVMRKKKCVKEAPHSSTSTVNTGLLKRELPSSH